MQARERAEDGIGGVPDSDSLTIDKRILAASWTIFTSSALAECVL
jgi:hypothetical protein